MEVDQDLLPERQELTSLELVEIELEKIGGQAIESELARLTEHADG